jgi:hypothetical protein
MNFFLDFWLTFNYGLSNISWYFRVVSQTLFDKKPENSSGPSIRNKPQDRIYSVAISLENRNDTLKVFTMLNNSATKFMMWQNEELV